MQHITGSAAHIGMDYHTVTLRLTPTDNKLQTDVHRGRMGEEEEEEGGSEREDWGESRRGRRNKQHTHCFMLPVCVVYFVGSFFVFFL